ncbi:MAG: hypothetical protein JW737_00125 [Acidobacteria bacterium]|nr:hypothetical protein [Acidobacteriota bacterium]
MAAEKQGISLDNLREKGILKEKSAQIFELGMWIKAIESYFRLEGNTLFRSEGYSLAQRNFVEEIKIIDNLLLRITRLCVSIIGTEEWNLMKFYEYVDNILLKKDKPRIINQPRNGHYQKSIQDLFDQLADIRLIIKDFLANSRISYDAFIGVGKIINREIASFPFLYELKGYEFNQIYDRVENAKISRIVKQISDRQVRKEQARIFLELFRLLNYLRFIDPGDDEIRRVKMSLPIYAQFYNELHILFDHIEDNIRHMSSHLISYAEVLRNFIHGTSAELKKVFNHELLGIVILRNDMEIRKKVLDSSRILQNHIERSIVRFGQFFDRSLKGGDIFEHFVTRREETLKLRRILLEIMKSLDAFMMDKDKGTFKSFISQIKEFKDDYLKYLRYQDWEVFDRYITAFLKAKSQRDLLRTSEDFNKYLTELFQQIGSRSVLSDEYLKV